MRWYKNWCMFRFYRALGRLQLIFILMWIYVLVKYWYITVPLSIVLLVKGLNVAEEEATKQQIAEQQKQYKLNKIIERANEIVNVRFNDDLTLDQCKDLLKKTEDLLQEIKGTEEEYELRYELIPLRSCPQLFKDKIRYMERNNRG